MPNHFTRGSGTAFALTLSCVVAAAQVPAYTQPARDGRPYNQYHGTLEAKPVTATTPKLVYTLFFDNSMLPDAPARDRDVAAKTATFKRALQNMKTLAEGGKLPPPAPRGQPPGR